MVWLRRASPMSVAVIGGGPAGLAAAVSLSAHGAEVTVYEAGNALAARSLYAEDEVAVGIGGAGLFCDGKFSYFPSGSQLYCLRDVEKLKAAFDWLNGLMNSIGIPSEPFPSLSDSGPYVKGSFLMKAYPSHYGSLHKRRRLIRAMCESIRGDLFVHSKVICIRRDGLGYHLEALSSTNGTVSVGSASAIVLATGRFGGLDVADRHLSAPLPLDELRYEFGLRIESHHAVGPLAEASANDLKLLWNRQGIAFRTFCTCRRGEIWHIPYGSLSAISGRASSTATEYSNFSILARFEGDKLARGRALWQAVKSKASASQVAYWEPLRDFLTGECSTHCSVMPTARPWYPVGRFQQEKLADILGGEMYSVLRAGVSDLVDAFPTLDNPATVCLFPVIEGTGRYPSTDGDLRINGEHIWCAGDVVGRFRGLVPALASGYYAGLAAMAVLRAHSSVTGKVGPNRERR